MFEWIRSTIATLGYAGIAALAFLENVFPPIPSELVIPLAGYIAAEGDMRLRWVIASGTLGSLAGGTLWYVVGRKIGERRMRAWVNRSGRWLTLTERDLDRAQGWFQRHGRMAVLFGRMVPGVRTLVSLPAGFGRMPLAEFLLYSLVGTATWTMGLAYAGVLLRANFAAVGDWINLMTNVVLGLIGFVVLRRFVKCWRQARSSRDGNSVAPTT
jgi:membrane protein DedA with SNARE-associated domain